MKLRPATLFSMLLTVLIIAAAVLAPRPDPAPAPALTGFAPAAAAAERHWEHTLQAGLDRERMRADLGTLSAAPHNAGSARQHELAGWLQRQFEADGFQVHLEPFDVLYPTPIERQVELVAPRHYTASLREPALKGDAGSAAPGALPTFLMYSADGDVTAPLVYVNYGVAADYAALARLGVSVRGKIVIARYGQGWRGLKPRLAYEHGAVGCLIYSDPRDDGSLRGPADPAGPWRPAGSVQRGSVLEMTLAPGDPETPGWGSLPGARRLPLDQVTNLQKIPVLPLSAADAQPLLDALGGPPAPAAWRGGLPIAYHTGPGPARVHLAVKFHWGLARINDVIATIPGSAEPDSWIIRGNHYDAWVDGADDPDSGLTALLEEARGLGALLRQGWRPRRTIIYAAWDAEEPSLLGSTEWVETHAAELNRHAVAYLNTDMSQGGALRIGGSQALEAFADGLRRAVAAPGGTGTLWDEAARVNERQHGALVAGQLPIAALGSGSDFSPFLDHVGIAALDFGFSGGSPGVYHSAYDDAFWYTHFGDPGFEHEQALAAVVGTAVLRLADAEVLPFQFSGLAAHLVSDEREAEAALRARAHAPAFDWAPLRQAIAAMREAAAGYDEALRARGAADPAHTAALNRLLMQSERALLDPEGLAGRPWYRNLLYAPGRNTGYAAVTLPGLREAIAAGNDAEAVEAARKLATALDVLSRQLRAARADL